MCKQYVHDFNNIRKIQTIQYLVERFEGFLDSFLCVTKFQAGCAKIASNRLYASASTHFLVIEKRKIYI